MARKKNGSDILSFSLPKELTADVDTIMEQMGYSNRSEVIRDALRGFLDKQKKLSAMDGIVEGVLTILYSHDIEKVVHEILHDNTEIFRSFLHLDFNAGPHRCCDVVVFQGKAQDVKVAINKIEATNMVENVRVMLA